MRRLPEDLMDRLVKLGHRARPRTSSRAEESGAKSKTPTEPSSAFRALGTVPANVPEEPTDKTPIETIGEAPSDLSDAAREAARKRGWHKHWIWPAGLAVAGIGSTATLLLRGCWHTHMSWPMTVDHEFSYQVCTSCGIKRLYDEKAFQAYGPYGYDVDELIARERAYRAKRMKQAEERKARLERKQPAE